MTAIDDNEFTAAKEAIDALSAEYDDLRIPETARFDGAVVAREQRETPVSRELMSDYARTHSATALARSSFLGAAVAYLADPSSVEVDQATNVASNLRDQEASFQDLAPDVDDELTDVTLPPHVVVASASGPDGPALVDEPVTIEVTVANVGDGPATGVMVTASVGGDGTVTPESTSVDGLDGGESAAVDLTFTADASGTHSVTIATTHDDASSGNPRAERKVSVEIVAPADLAEAAMETIATVRDRVESAELDRGLERSLLAKLDTAESKVEDGLAALNQGQEQQANGQFKAATRSIGAFLNQLSAGDDSNGRGGGGRGQGNNGSGAGDLPETLERSIKQLAQNTIEQLSLARNNLG